ncbi:hypothetical protein [Propionivibrio sp.]|uniref:hypothetical protein n=1 Tax=Propionivibrio sp. TaxID=2212460 RepID=UPI002608F91A|nr:hypothetical protein [Propionivibrio sp.]
MRRRLFFAFSQLFSLPILFCRTVHTTLGLRKCHIALIENMPLGFVCFSAAGAVYGFNQRITDAPVEWSGCYGSFFSVLQLEVFLEIKLGG